jgi:hypothetical protein
MIVQNKLERAYKQLLYVSYSKYPDVEPSFTDGLWEEEEYYKYRVWAQARAALKLETWESHKDDPRYIYDRAVAAINACENLLATDHSQEAQLAYRSTYNQVVVKLLENLDKTAEALYGIFSTESVESDGLYFDMLAKVLHSINDGYSFVAYFFFLKNKDQYVPVRRKGDAIRLQKLGVSVACMANCSWKNYMAFLDIIREIQVFLQEKGIETSLLDAQSFLWMLWMIDKATPEYKERIDPYETVIEKPSVGYKEGKRTEVYGTKYERDPKLRREFLKTQKKPYTCEACGMDFESVYGNIGKDMIEVHHKTPLSVNGEEQVVYPSSEYLACLCANCHRIIHKKTGAIMTVEELKTMIDRQRREKQNG